MNTKSMKNMLIEELPFSQRENIHIDFFELLQCFLKKICQCIAQIVQSSMAPTGLDVINFAEAYFSDFRLCLIHFGDGCVMDVV